MNRQRIDEPRSRALRISSVLLLVAIVPLLGLGVLTWSAIGDARADVAAAERTEALAERAVVLVDLSGALFDETVWTATERIAVSLGVPTGIVSQFADTDPAAQQAAAVARTDELVARAGIDWLAGDVAAARAVGTDFAALLVDFVDVTERVELELDAVLAELSASPGTGDGRLIRAIDVLGSAVDLRASVADGFNSYFGLAFDVRDRPSVELERLIRSRAAFDEALAHLRGARAEFPALGEGVATIETDRSLAEFLEAVDERLATSYAEGVPEAGNELSIWALTSEIDALTTVYRAGAESANTTSPLFDAAAASIIDAAAAAREHADAQIQRSYLLAAGLTAASFFAAWLATRFIVRPLRDLRQTTEALQGEEPPAPLEPTGPSEVRAAAAAIHGAATHLDLVTRQARALASGDLDAEVLDEVAPGGLGGAVQHAVGTLRSALTQQDEFRRRLAHEAAHDGLTKLPNRNASMAQLTRSLARTERSGSPLAVLFIDLDHFKDVNDHHGHQAGDQVLRTVATRLVSGVREGDHVGRLGGDEFVVVAEPVDGVDEAISLGERIIDLLAEPIDLGPARVSVGASVGVAVSATADLTADELLRDADLAVYRAKQLGRGGVHLCDEQLREEMLQTADLSAAIRRAIEEDELLLHYQPIVDTDSQQLHAFEALVRWQRPGEDGLVPPDDFIPFAERSALIVDLDRWVIDAAARQLAAWADAGRFVGVPVAINLSGRHLAHHDVVRHVLDPLELHGVDPSSVIIEITESALLEDLVNAAIQLEQLRSVGVRVSIDDFGTGYTSLAHLRSLPIDILKIDRSFTVNAARDVHEASIVKLIIDTGHLLGAKITAEGIETLVEADELTRLGTDSLQGFYFSRPQPPDRIVIDAPVATPR